MYYNATTQERNALDAAINIMYPQQVKNNIRYTLSFTKIGGEVRAEVNWERGSTSNFKLVKLNSNQPGWRMTSDWKD